MVEEGAVEAEVVVVVQGQHRWGEAQKRMLGVLNPGECQDEDEDMNSEKEAWE